MVALAPGGPPSGLRPAPLRAYATAIALALVATVLRLLLTPWLGTELPFLTYFPAIFVAAWALGLRPTLLTVALSALAANFFFFAPLYRFNFSFTDNPIAVIGLALFVLVGVGVSLLAEGADSARRRAELEAAKNRRLRESAESEAEAAKRAVAHAEGLAAEREAFAGTLETERSRLDAVLRQMPAGVVIRDAAGRLLAMNAECERLIGTVPERVEPDTVDASIRDPNGRPLPFEELPLARVIREGRPVHGVEMLMQRDDGSTVWLMASAGPMRDAAGALAAVVTVFADVTAHRATERALHESRAQLELALEAGRMGSFVWLLAEDRIVWSPMAERLRGHAPGTLGTRPEAYFAGIHPDDRERLRAEVAEVLAGRREYQVEYRVVRPTGDVLWVEGRGRLVRDANGVPERLVGLSIDITDRRHAEEAARRSQRLEAMGQLAAGIAHDTNNMQAAVLGWAHLLHRQVARGTAEPARMQHDLEEIIKAAERTASLSQQLLTFSRRQVVAPEVLDLAVAVGEARDMLRRMIGPTVTLDLQLAEQSGSVLLDRTQLVQVLLNLAINARDAMPDGGRLSVRTYPAGAEPGDGPRAVALEVSDTGAGMDEATRLRVFEPFFTTKPVGQGTGLGLSTVHGIVTQAGGTIDLESAPGAGTTFRITLPAVAAPASAASLAAADGDGAAKGRVLLVEDDESVRVSTKRMLEEEGYTVDVAESGTAAWRMLEAGLRPAALLTDLTMPGMSGRELATRARASRPDLPIVVITGHYDVDPEEFARTRIAVVQKPFSPDALAGALARVRQAR